MGKDSNQSLLRVRRGREGQQMLPTLQLCPEFSTSQGLGSISTAQDRGGEAETGRLISQPQRSITRQSQEEDGQGQLNNVVKTGQNQESRAGRTGIYKAARGSLEATCLQRFQCRLNSLSSLVFSFHLSPRGESVVLRLSGAWSRERASLSVLRVRL